MAAASTGSRRRTGPQSGRLRVTGPHYGSLRRGIRRALICLIALAAVGAGTALAAGANRIRLTVPKHARIKHSYSLALGGHAATSERLYLFVDYHRCGRNPAVEHRRAPGYYWTVDGSFHEVSRGWTSHLRGVDHSCGYLQKLSEPLNAPGGILARAQRSYRIR
jgi:hypothetical protein